LNNPYAKLSGQGKGYTLTFISDLFSASVYGVGKWVMMGVPPIALVALTFSISTVIMAIWAGSTGQWRDLLHVNARGWANIALYTAVSTMALLAMWTGIKHLDPTVASFIGRLQTLVSVCCGVLILKERLRPIEAIGGLVVIAGVVIIKASFAVHLTLWFWVMVASGTLWGLNEVMAKISLRHLSPVPLNLVRNAGVMVIYLILAGSKGFSLINYGTYWWGILAIGIAGPIFSRLFYLYALQHLGVAKTALINQSQPLYVSVIALVLLGIFPTLREWAGGLLILAGCIIMIAGPGKAAIARKINHIGN
jgi:drug/metabolite transporter (DMT)-like permease